ncbi:AMP-dependent synthetase [Terrihabitans soli]|uniref:AMP-dependent synthetase n=1 Tax=Terrihabitans soli TaxID=708113 RepID=A0A6S6QQU2_9HYPH|nr:AMP-dependent synthetase [Terrihabitans soli]
MPKLVRLSHANLLANARSIIEYLGVRTTDRAITSLPPSYSYGLSVINSHLVAGASLVLTDKSVADEEFWQLFSQHGATSFAGVPHSFDLIERTGALNPPPKSLRYFTQAGGRLSPEKVRALSASAGAAGIGFFVMYGQTEASPRIAYVPPDLLTANPDVIGIPVPGGRLSLENDLGIEIAENEVEGELVYRGPNVMLGYADAPQDLARGSEVTELRTGDLAVRNTQGLYRIVGRKGRFLKLYGLRISLDDVQDFVASQGFEGAAAGDDSGLAVAAVDIDDPEALAQAIVAKYKLSRAVVTVANVPSIPRLASGKVNFPAVAALRQTSMLKSAGKPSLREELAQLLGKDSISPEQSFAQAGGDSLNFIGASLLIEERLGFCPSGWEQMPVRQIEALQPVAEREPSVAGDIFMRCLAICLVIYHHSTEFAMDGAASALMMIAGYNFGRFQVDRVQSVGPWKTALPLLLRLVPVYYVIVISYFVLKGQIHWPTLLGYSNFQETFENGRAVIIFFWFIEAYVQIMVACILLASLPLIGALHRAKSWILPAGLLAVAVAFQVIGDMYPQSGFARFHTPFMTFLLFAVGWSATYCRDDIRRIVGGICFVCLLILFPENNTNSGYFMVLGTAIVLVWIPRISVYSPRMATLIARVSAASLYIYIMGPFVFYPLREIFGFNNVWMTLFLAIPGSVAAGIAVQKLVDRVADVIRKRKYAELQAGRPSSVEASQGS